MSVKNAPTYHEEAAVRHVEQSKVMSNRALTTYHVGERERAFNLADYEILLAIHHDLCRIATVLERA